MRQPQAVHLRCANAEHEGGCCPAIQRSIALLVGGLLAGLASAQTLPSGGIGSYGSTGPTTSGIGGDIGSGIFGGGLGAAGGNGNAGSGSVAGQAGVSQPAVPQASGAGQRGVTIVPRIETGILYSNNVGFSTNDRHGGFVYELSPGVRVSSYGGRVRGFFDYTLRGFAYSGGAAPATLRNELNGLATLEAVERRVFVDLGGQISRSTISAFGVQPSDASRASTNTTEVRNYFVSPYAKGRLSDQANYELRYRGSVLSSGSTSPTDATVQEFLGYLREDYPNRHVGWALEGGRTIVDYRVSRDIDASAARAVLSWIVNPQFRLYGSGGREVNNFLSDTQRGYTTIGAGFRWRPSQRTRLEYEQQRRFFGEGHTFVAETRTAQSALRVIDVKDVVIGRGLGDIGAQGSVYDLLFSQFASTEPDPDKRAQLVNQYLQRNGFSGNAPVNSSVFAAASTLRRDQQLSYSLIGKRDVLTLLVGQVNSRLLDNSVVIEGDFARANEIRQRRVGATFAHALTPNATVNVTGLVQKVNSPGNTLTANLRTLSINYTNRIAPRLFFSAGASKSFSSGGDSTSFDEMSIFSRISLRF